MIIAIDGPAGAGKSTIAKALARRLNFLYIDTGAMYRALTVKILNKKIGTSDTRQITRTANSTSINLVPEKDGSLKILLDGKDVSRAIREPAVTAHVSDIAKIKEVRQIMLQLQRALGRKSDSVLEGRDIGTVVFPYAERKFFLDANFKVRVKRRLKDMKTLKVKSATTKTVAVDLKNRDTIDSTRKVAPLKMAKDAIYVDTTHMSIDEVTDTLLKHILLNNPQY